MIRKLDSLGRIVIPKEFRNKMNFENNGAVLMEFKDNTLILSKAYEDEEHIRKEIERLQKLLEEKENEK